MPRQSKVNVRDGDPVPLAVIKDVATSQLKIQTEEKKAKRQKKKVLKAQPFASALCS